VPETSEIYKTLDLALRVGEVLLSSGAGAADVAATMQSITVGCGLRGVDTDVTFTALSLSYQSSPDEPALIQGRNVRHRDIDYDDLTKVDFIVRDLLSGEIDREQARNRLMRIVSSGHRLPRWAVSVGWGVMAAGIGLLLGGDLVVTAIAFSAAVGIDVMRRAMSRRRLPYFYQQVAGGLLATLLAVAAAAVGIQVAPSLVISATIIMLLSGLGFMGAVQDALTGYYITSGARLLEVLLATAGIIAGVSGGLTVGQVLGVDLGRLTPGAAELSQLPAMTLGAAICAGAYAFASYAPGRSLVPIALTGALGQLVFYAIQSQQLGRAWAGAVAAVVIGVVSYSVAGRVRVPPLVVVVSGIVPLLPGLSIYRGLAVLSGGDASGDGVVDLITAAAAAISLASGVILGEYIAQPLKREVRRLEGRLSGPRLVGPIRARAVRRERERV
jgi:uncharacterized membrane protein YjjP (DUF1212 family)